MQFVRTLVLVMSAAGIAACGSVTPVTASTDQASAPGFRTQQVLPFGGGAYGGGGLGCSPYGTFGYGGITPACGLGGIPAVGYGGLGYGDLGYGGLGYGGLGYGGIGYPSYGYSSNYPVSGDIFGGTTVVNPQTGRIDRQPASLPRGVAEENAESFRPTGSAIWQRK